MKALHDELVTLAACSEAIEWVGRKSLATAWATCERADWMLWYAARRGVDQRILTRAACACARTALQYVPPGEERPRLAIEAAEAWADNPSESNRAASEAAAQAAWAASSATCAARAASEAAWSAAWAATSAACAARAAVAAAWAASAAGAHKEIADLVRGIITVKMLGGAEGRE